jgi:protein-S-isoprenylcysteine O-methyltransferase Ste14
MIDWVIFTAASAGIVAFSWPSLSRPRSHGFFRFFAFEAAECSEKFGESYAAYMKTTKMFIPYIF